MEVHETDTGTFDSLSAVLPNVLVQCILLLFLMAGVVGANPTVELQLENPVIVNDGSFKATVKISNSTDKSVSFSVPDQLERAIRVTAGDQTVKTSVADVKKTAERTLEARQFLGKTVRVSPEKSWDRPVRLSVSWKHGDLSSESRTAYYFPERIAKVDVKGYGPLFVSFYYEDAPRNIFHFSNLIRNESFYDGKEFHRLIKNYLLQGGAPKTGSEGSYEVDPELNDRKHRFGTVSMAHGHRTKKSGTEFFITLGRQHFLDGQYTVIGRVKKESRSVLRQIQEQVKTDHKKLGGQCGVDHTDAPKNPLVMKKVSLLTPEAYEKQSKDQSDSSGETSQNGGDDSSKSTSDNPLKSGSTSDDSDQ